MILTQKEISTLAIFNKKGLVYEYVEVQALQIGGGTKSVNKLVKIDAKAKKENKANTSEMSSLSMAEIQDADEARRQQARRNNL